MDPSKAILDDVRVPGEILHCIFDHLVDDTPTIRSCTLVSHTWSSFSQPHLLRNIACPIKSDSSLHELLDFLNTKPDSAATNVRSLKVFGPVHEPYVDLGVQDLLAILQKLPQLERLALECLTLSSHPHSEPASVSTSKPHIKSISLCGIGSSPTTADALCALKVYLAPSNLSVTLAIASFPDAAVFQQFIDIVGTRIGVLSLNPLGGMFPLTTAAKAPFIENGATIPEVTVSTAPCSSLIHLVLFFTASGAIDKDTCFIMYWSVLSMWSNILQHTPPGVRHLTLRFQRYGPHTKETMRALEVLGEPDPHSADDLTRGWFKRIEESLLGRLPDLESVTCVLFDGGYTKDWKNLLAEAGIGGPLEGISGEKESGGGDDGYDDYVAFLIKAFPRLDAQGLLRFERV
ncbi:hypothetical protein C8Q74DRAFT_364774 [Fomes fomentarius]|nr:hypothetical protein C8Q74DRAFT_364774 [Fomes fomentarius]